MKINETQRLSAIQYYQRQQAMNQVPQKPSRRDELIIPMEALEMLDAQNLVDYPARSERIANLKKEVSTGTYHVEVDKIAEKLLPLFRKENE